MKVNKILYSVLSFFLGGLGVHKFFVNKTGLGLLYLLFCWTGIPGVIGIIEGIVAILKPADKDGCIIINWYYSILINNIKKDKLDASCLLTCPFN